MLWISLLFMVFFTSIFPGPSGAAIGFYGKDASIERDIVFYL